MSSLYKVTLKDIAKKTGYSINTVSRALKDKEDISAATRKMIQDTAKEMGYINNSVASSLRSGYTRTIAVILGDISNPHFSIIVKEIEKNARKHKYSTIILNTDEDPKIEEQAVYSALSKKVDGIIICPTQKSKANIELLKKTGVPFVLIGRYFADIDTDYVICNDIQGGYLATRHLIKRGHRRILLLNGPAYISSARERLEGYRRALAESGIEYDEKLVHEIPVTLGDCRHVIRKLLDEGIGFTGIFAFSDLIAWEAIYALHKLGYRVPQDIAVVGFDNIQSRYLFPFPLTSVGNYKGRMSKRAFDIVLKRINSNFDGKYIHDIVDTRLIVRESS